MSNRAPSVATRWPTTMGPVWWLCRACNGTGEGKSAGYEAAAHGGKAVEIFPGLRFRGPPCTKCNGKGIVLEKR